MHSRISPRAALAAAASICLACMMALAPQAATDVGTKMVAARQANAALLKQYQWNCRTEIYMDNQLKDTRVEQLAYGVDGSLTEVPPPTDIAILDRRVHPDDPKARDIERLDLAHQLQTVLPGTGECPLVAVGEFVVAGKQRGRQR